MASKGKRLAALLEALYRCRERKAEAVKEYGVEIRDLEMQIRRLATEIQTGQTSIEEFEGVIQRSEQEGGKEVPG